MNNILVNSRSFIFNFKDPNEQILQALRYDAQGVQISFLEYEVLMKFKPNNKVKELLKEKEYNILHAPTNITYDEFQNSLRVLKKLKELYTELNCKCIVFHYNSLSMPELVIKELQGINITIENLDKRSVEIMDYLTGFFKKYPEFKLTLDFCHAISHSKNHLKNLYENFYKKIENIHWSINQDDWMRHNSPSRLYNEKKNNIDFMIKYLKKLNKPIILEIRRNYVEHDLNIIKEEIDFLRKKLN